MILPFHSFICSKSNLKKQFLDIKNFKLIKRSTERTSIYKDNQALLTVSITTAYFNRKNLFSPIHKRKTSKVKQLFTYRSIFLQAKSNQLCPIKVGLKAKVLYAKIIK